MCVLNWKRTTPKTNLSSEWHSFVCWQLKFHVLNLLHKKVTIKWHIIQCNTVTLVQTVSVHILKHKFSHAQLEACKYSSVNMHMLTWKHTYAELEVYACSTGSVHIFKCKHAHAHLKTRICLTGSLHMLNWKCAHVHVHAHDQMKACTCLIATESMHMFT